jgi:hypothetical protein
MLKDLNITAAHRKLQVKKSVHSTEGAETVRGLMTKIVGEPISSIMFYDFLMYLSRTSASAS